MNILILSYADHLFREVGCFSEINKRTYAKRHGYHFSLETNRLCARGASWQKIPYVQINLLNYDWIFWTDADSLICRPDIRLEDIIGNSNADFIAAKDENGINCGQFLVRNSPWSHFFLRKIFDYESCIDHPWQEQGAIMEMLTKDLYQCNAHFDFVPQSALNAHPSVYKEGDFLIHFSGYGTNKGMDALLEMMRQHLKQTL